MAVAPLQLPTYAPVPQINWSPLNQIGDTIANYRKGQAVANALSGARNQDGTLDPAKAGAALSQLGMSDEARPYIALAQAATQHADTVAQQQAQLTESTRHDKATESQAGAALSEAKRQHDLELTKPLLAGEDPYTGAKAYVVRDAAGNYKPVVLPQQQIAAAPAATPAPTPDANASPEDQRKAALLASRPPAVRPIIEGIANYTMDPRTILARIPASARERIMADVAELRPDYNQQNYPASQAAYTKFTSGQQSTGIRAFNVGLEHLDQLSELGKALDNGDVRVINDLRNRWRTETGSDAPTNFNGLKAIVGAEIVKAIVGAGGTGEERAQAAQSVSAASSPQQLAGIVSTYKNAMGAQLSGLKRTYEQGTFRKDFNRMLSPAAVTALTAHEKATGAAGPAAFDPANTKIPMADAKLLQAEPTPQRRQQFDAVYGVGASDRVLGPAK